MHPDETLVRDYLQRLAARDAEGAAALCHAEIFYTNPLFPRLHGRQAADFWRFTFHRLEDWRLEVRCVQADDGGGRAEWSARYTLRGRKVVTKGHSLFAFAGGRVRRHYDHFSLWRWCAAVAGPAGAMLGWLGPVRWAARRALARRLERESAG